MLRAVADQRLADRCVPAELIALRQERLLAGPAHG